MKFATQTIENAHKYSLYARGDVDKIRENLVKDFRLVDLRKIAKEEFGITVKSRDTKAVLAMKIAEVIREVLISEDKNTIDAEYTIKDEQAPETPALPAKVEEPEQPEVIRFEVGKSYMGMYFGCGTSFYGKVIRRTQKTVWVKNGGYGEISKHKIKTARSSWTQQQTECVKDKTLLLEAVCTMNEIKLLDTQTQEQQKQSEISPTPEVTDTQAQAPEIVPEVTQQPVQVTPAEKHEQEHEHSEDRTPEPAKPKPKPRAKGKLTRKSLLTLDTVNVCETPDELRDILMTAKKAEVIDFVKQFGIDLRLYKGLNTLDKIATFCATKILVIHEHKQRTPLIVQPEQKVTPKTHTDKHGQIVIDFDSPQIEIEYEIAA